MLSPNADEHHDTSHRMRLNLPNHGDPLESSVTARFHRNFQFWSGQRHVAPRYVFLAVSAIFMMLFAACGSGSEGQATEIPATPRPIISQPTHTAVDPTTAVQATLIPETPTPGSISADSVSYPGCIVNRPTGTGSLGSAPGPTPTPLPGIDSRDPVVVKSELSAYLSAATPIVLYLAGVSNEFNDMWAKNPPAVEQAMLLQTLGSRAAIGCSAASLITDIPPEASGFDTRMREAARARHTWVATAVEQLLCCGSSVTTETEFGNSESSEIIARLISEASEIGLTFDLDHLARRLFMDNALGIELTIDANWLVASEGLSPVFYAPAELNDSGSAGLGPDSWRLGTALRIRRLRNPGVLTATEASSRFAGLISRHGSVANSHEIELGGLTGLRHELVPELTSWNASVVVIVSGEFTYFVELGCPALIPGACTSVGETMATLRVAP